MGIDLWTALVIQNNDVNVETYYFKQDENMTCYQEWNSQL
jgi:hypothetical protein